VKLFVVDHIAARLTLLEVVAVRAAIMMMTISFL
jgi:hypothetical protein